MTNSAAASALNWPAGDPRPSAAGLGGAGGALPGFEGHVLQCANAESYGDLIANAKAKDPQLGADLEREFWALSFRLSFGLNFERHRPEAVELPQRPVRWGDRVRVVNLINPDVRKAAFAATTAESLYWSAVAGSYP